MTTPADLAAADARLRATAREAAQSWLRDRIIFAAPDPAVTAADLVREHGAWLDAETFAQLAALV